MAQRMDGSFHQVEEVEMMILDLEARRGVEVVV